MLSPSERIVSTPDCPENASYTYVFTSGCLLSCRRISQTAMGGTLPAELSQLTSLKTMYVFVCGRKRLSIIVVLDSLVRYTGRENGWIELPMDLFRVMLCASVSMTYIAPHKVYLVSQQAYYYISACHDFVSSAMNLQVQQTVTCLWIPIPARHSTCNAPGAAALWRR